MPESQEHTQLTKGALFAKGAESGLPCKYTLFLFQTMVLESTSVEAYIPSTTPRQTLPPALVPL